MLFVYIGTDEAADPNGTEAFGLYFPIGEAVEVTNDRVIAKLLGHPHFEAAGEGVVAAEPKRRGRPPKVAPEQTGDHAE